MSNLFWFFIFVSILIFAHEGGHFLFAKLFRVKVVTFCLGFGGPIRIGRFKMSFKPGETEYRLAWFPIGGFVRMMGDDPSEEIAEADRPRAFLTQPAWKRFFIILGGPLFSVLLAIPIYFVYHLSQDMAWPAQVGHVVAGSPAAEAGILPGDKILSIGDVKCNTADDLYYALEQSDGQEVLVRVQRQDQTLDYRIKPYRKFDESELYLLEEWDLGIRIETLLPVVGVVVGSPAHLAGLRSWDEIVSINSVEVENWNQVRNVLNQLKPGEPFEVVYDRRTTIHVGAFAIITPVYTTTQVQPLPVDQTPDMVLRIGAVYTGIESVALYVMDTKKGFPADKAGVLPNDKLVAMYSKPIHSWEQFTRIVYEHRDEKIPITIRRGSKLIEVAIKPTQLENETEFRQKNRKPGIGVTYGSYFGTGGVEQIKRNNLLRYAAHKAIARTVKAIVLNVNGFVRIFQGRVKATEAVGGPLMIIQVAGKSAERSMADFFNVLAVLSVLIGMLNLLPIPILDGGHIMFILIEAIRRKPLSLGARVVASYVGLTLLILIFAFAIFNDISRYWVDITSVFG